MVTRIPPFITCEWPWVVTAAVGINVGTDAASLDRTASTPAVTRPRRFKKLSKKGKPALLINTCTCRFEPSLTRSAAKPVEPMTCSMHVRACMHPKWPVTGRFECNDQINSSTIKDHRPSKQEARSHSARGPPLSVDQTLSLHLTFTGRARLGVHARRLVTGTAKCRLGPSPPQAGG